MAQTRKNVAGTTQELVVRKMGAHCHFSPPSSHSLTNITKIHLEFERQFPQFYLLFFPRQALSYVFDCLLGHSAKNKSIALGSITIVRADRRDSAGDLHRPRIRRSRRHPPRRRRAAGTAARRRSASGTPARLRSASGTTRRLRCGTTRAGPLPAGGMRRLRTSAIAGTGAAVPMWISRSMAAECRAAFPANFSD